MNSKSQMPAFAVALAILIFAGESRSNTAFRGVALSEVSLTGWVRSAFQANEPTVKIAYVDPQALLAAAPGRPAAESLLTGEVNRDDAQLKKMQDSITALLTKYQKDEATLSSVARDKSQKTIQVLEADFQAKQALFQQQIQQRENEVMAPVTDLVRKVLGDIREEGGYSIIFGNDPRGSSIVAADKNLDITDRVVSRLRATSPPKAPATTKGAPPAPAGVTPPKPPAR